MKSNIIILLMAFAFVGLPQISTASTYTFPTEEKIGDVNISVKNKIVRIRNAAQKILEVYNITGIRISKYSIDSSDKSINLNLQRGCYILKVGKIVRKISIL